MDVMTEDVEHVTPSDFGGSVKRTNPLVSVSDQMLEVAVVEEEDGKFVVELRFDELEETKIDGAVVEEHAVEQSVTIEVPDETGLLEPSIVGVPLTVEGLVGQVNGRPIFADEVLEPIADELYAESLRLTESAFEDQARMLVGLKIEQMIINDLFLSEARSELSPEQKQGLIAFMRKLREDLVSEEGGSATRVEQRLWEEEGKTVEEFLEYRQQEALIEQYIQQKILPRVHVTWRDVLRAWERLRYRYETSGQVELGWIFLPREGSEEMAGQVSASLASGVPFSEVAESVGMRDGGRWKVFPTGDGGVADIEVAAELKTMLEGMVKGEVRGPATVRSSLVWLTILDISQPRTASIYDPNIQMEIRDNLFGQRFAEEQDRFVRSLLNKGSYDAIETMKKRVALIAIGRYAR